MLRPLLWTEIEQSPLIPHAILNRPVSFFADQMAAKRFDNQDDFDSYEATAAILNNQLRFAIKRYRGESVETATIFLPQSITDVSSITQIIEKIVHEFGLSSDSIIWQRKDNPEL